MTAAPLRQPDYIGRIALFGARFVDSATGRAVSDGLTVTVYPKEHPDKRRDTFCTPGGVFALQRVPGLDRLTPLDPADPTLPLDLSIGELFWSRAIAASGQYRVEVRDRSERFLPISYPTSIPTPGPHGTATDPSGLPEPRTLYSAPARIAPPAVGVIRGELRKKATDTEREQPLAYALLVVEIAAKTFHGIADAAGKVAVMFNLPEPLSLEGQKNTPFVWPAGIKVYHADVNGGPADRYEHLPCLDDLIKQGDGLPLKVFTHMSNPADPSQPPEPVDPVELFAAEIHFGKELVLRTGSSPFLFASPA